MDRRTFVRTAGTGVTAAVGLAGCSENDDGSAESSADSNAEASLAIASYDTEGVPEPDTIYMSGTVENSGEAAGSGMILGVIEKDDVTYEQRREVTVPAGEEIPFNLKFRHHEGLLLVFQSECRIEADPSGEETASDGFHDLVIVDSEGPTEDGIEAGTPTITASVENRGQADRTATLEAEVTVSDVPYTEQREVTVSSGETEAFDVEVSIPEPSGVYTYNGTITIPEE